LLSLSLFLCLLYAKKITPYKKGVCSLKSAASVIAAPFQIQKAQQFPACPIGLSSWAFGL